MTVLEIIGIIAISLLYILAAIKVIKKSSGTTWAGNIVLFLAWWAVMFIILAIEVITAIIQYLKKPYWL